MASCGSIACAGSQADRWQKVTMRFPKLFEPGRVGTMEVKNRIIGSPMETELLHRRGTRHAALHRLHGGARARRRRDDVHGGDLRRSARQGPRVPDGPVRRRPDPAARAPRRGRPPARRPRRAGAELRRPRGAIPRSADSSRARLRSCRTSAPAAGRRARWTATASPNWSTPSPRRRGGPRRRAAISSAFTARTATCSASSCRPTATSAKTNTAAISPAACAFRWP